MLITFSHPLDRAASYVREAAARADVTAMIGHIRPSPDDLGTEVRFTLGKLPDGAWPASVAQHDQVIRQLLTLDPQAHIRIARATYEGLQDFEAQLKARVP